MAQYHDVSDLIGEINHQRNHYIDRLITSHYNTIDAKYPFLRELFEGDDEENSKLSQNFLKKVFNFMVNQKS